MTLRGRFEIPAVVVAAVLVVSTVVRAQAPDHSGTWRLSRDASQIAKGAGLTGLGAGGVPPTLYVTQSANGTAVVGSDINESAAKLYQVSTKGLVLEREGTTEHISLSTDGKTLTVRITAAAGSTTLVYTKTSAALPCEQWPTACRW
jgi:hypothetical protein